MEHLINNRVKLRVKRQPVWLILREANGFVPVGKKYAWFKKKILEVTELTDWAKERKLEDDIFVSAEFSLIKTEPSKEVFQTKVDITTYSPFAFLLWKQEFLRHFVNHEQFVNPSTFVGGLEVFFEKGESEDGITIFECLAFYYKNSREELVLNFSSKRTRIESCERQIQGNEKYLNPGTYLCEITRDDENTTGFGFAGREKHIAPDRFDYTERYKDLKSKILDLSMGFRSDFFESIETTFIEINSNDLFTVLNSSQKMVFGFGKAHINASHGMRDYGPFKKIDNPSDIELIFIFQNKDDANNLYIYLKKRLKHFPGLQSYVGIPVSLADEKLKYSSPEILEKELEIFIQNNLKNDEYQNKLAIVIGPFKKYESEEVEEELYYNIKHKLLEKGIPSQFISTKTIRDRNFHYSLPNIAIAILAKLGGIPWKLNTSKANELVLGFNVSKSSEESFIGNAVFFNNDGELGGVRGFSSTDASGIVNHLRDSIKNYTEVNGEPTRLVIHYYKTANSKEIISLEYMLRQELNLDLPYAIVEINDTRSKMDICFDASYDFGMPKSGTYVKISRDEYLLFNNSRYVDKPMSLSIQELPVKLKIAHISSEVFSNRELISQVYEFSRLNWKGLKQNSLPATITFSKWIAEYASRFGGQIPEALNAQKRPWFL